MKKTNPRLVAVVDSNDKHRNMVVKAIAPFYDVKAWDEAWKALTEIPDNLPFLILIGPCVLPGKPLNFIKQLRKNVILEKCPILYLADETDSEKLLVDITTAGAQDHMKAPLKMDKLLPFISRNQSKGVEKDWNKLPETQRSALKNSVAVFNDIADSFISGEAVSFSSVKENCQPMVDAIENNDFKGILDGVRNHDDYTYAHSIRVATMLSLLGKTAGFNNEEQLMLASGGLLHDVGKMKIPYEILNKPGRLDDEEFDIIKTHVPKTIEYLKTSGGIPKAVFIISEQHHEKIDGTGYPHGLKGKELNELARMAAVVDVFSALTDRRVYKPSMPTEKAIKIMTEEMVTHLDQHYVKMFRGILGDSNLLS